jgi:2'-5' RNA ligase
VRRGAGRRLFAAVDLPDAERARLEAEVAAAALDPRVLRLLDPAQWHLTVAFYGDVTDQQAPELMARLERAAARTPAFSIQLEHAGAFPANPKQATVVWMGVSGDLDVLARLSDRCRAAGRRAGATLQKQRFHPHVTVARARHGTADADAVLARLWRYRGQPWPVTSFRLVHSTLGSTVRHETVAQFSLLD